MLKLRAATDTFLELSLIYGTMLAVSAAILSRYEGIDFLTGLYWAATTATSTGYGDISPKTGVGQLTAVILMHLSIFVVAPLIVVRLVDRLNDNRDAFTHEEQLHILEGLARIEARLDAIESSGRNTPA